MAKFRRGKEAAAAAATRGGSGKFTPTHIFKAGETTFLQFLTSWKEIPTVLFHKLITVGFHEDGSKIYRDFISPLDEGIDGAIGHDPLVERFGSYPKERCIGLAVELMPQYEKQGTRKVIVGWDVVTREYKTDDGTKQVPNVALVNESPYTLYNHLGVVDDTHPIEDNILQITRTGTKTDTSYTIIPVAKALSEEVLTEAGVDDFFEEFDFDSYLEELGSKERLHAEIDPLPDDFVVNPFAKKGKGKASAASSRSTRTKVDDGDGEVAEPAAEGQDSGSPRRRRFEQLREEVSS